jgi:hypothetical protein
MIVGAGLEACLAMALSAFFLAYVAEKLKGNVI